MIITIDIDGVLAGGEYIPEWERYPERYLSLPLLEKDLTTTIHKLARKHSLYLLSSRGFPNALDYTRMWLEENSFSMSDFCGVIVGLGKTKKVYLVDTLKADCHIDDDYRVVSELPNKGLFVYHESARSHYPWSAQAVANGKGYHRNWKEIIQSVDLVSSLGAVKLLSTAGDASREWPVFVPPAEGRVEQGVAPLPMDQLGVLRRMDNEI